MKVAILSESPADEAAIRILADGLLAKETEPVLVPTPGSRGHRAVLNSVRPALNHLHYSTDADALVLTLDSDETPVHQRGHDEPGRADEECRLWRLRASVEEVQRQLRPRQGRGPIKTALGLAVPAIEAWCLAGTDPHITESTWLLALQSGRFPFTKNGLKEKLYGTARPSLAVEKRCLVEQARRLVDQRKLELLEKRFPSGFGALAADVRGW